jgi:hypothetical protein
MTTLTARYGSFPMTSRLVGGIVFTPPDAQRLSAQVIPTNSKGSAAGCRHFIPGNLGVDRVLLPHS